MNEEQDVFQIARGVANEKTKQTFMHSRTGFLNNNCEI